MAAFRKTILDDLVNLTVTTHKNPQTTNMESQVHANAKPVGKPGKKYGAILSFSDFSSSASSMRRHPHASGVPKLAKVVVPNSCPRGKSTTDHQESRMLSKLNCTSSPMSCSTKAWKKRKFKGVWRPCCRCTKPKFPNRMIRMTTSFPQTPRPRSQTCVLLGLNLIQDWDLSTWTGATTQVVRTLSMAGMSKRSILQPLVFYLPPNHHRSPSLSARISLHHFLMNCSIPMQTRILD